MQKQYAAGHITKLIEYGLYLFVFLLPWQTRLILRPGSLNGGYFEYGTLSVYGVDLLLLVLVLGFGVLKIWRLDGADLSPCPLPETGEGNCLRNNNSLWDTKWDWKESWLWIVILGVCLLISVFRSGDTLVAMQKYGWFLLGVGLFWILTQVAYSRKKLIVFFLAGAFTQAVLGLCQFIFQRTWSSSWLGLASHEASDLGVSVVEASGRWLRSYGGFDHPNIYGGFLAIAILIFLIFILGSSGLKKSWTVFLASIIGYLVLCLAVLFSFSRAAWISLAVGTVSLLFLSLLSKDKAGIRKVILGILIAGLIILPSAFSYSELLFNRLEASGRLESKSIAERQASLAEAWPIIRNNWLFGVGLGNYEGYVALKASPGLPSFAYQPVHNLYLLIWAETGILGLIAWLGLVFSLIYALFAQKIEAGPGGEYYHLSLIAALLTLGLFDHWLWSLHFGVLFFWMVFGLSGSVKQDHDFE